MSSSVLLLLQVPMTKVANANNYRTSATYRYRTHTVYIINDRPPYNFFHNKYTCTGQLSVRLPLLH